MIHKLMKGSCKKCFRTLAVFLSILFVLSSFTTVFADEEAPFIDPSYPGKDTPKGDSDAEITYPGKEVDDTYFIYVSTGICPGDSVVYFTVRYRDVNGIERNEFVFPHEINKDDAYKLASSVGNYATSVMNKVTSRTGYISTVSCDNAARMAAYSNDLFMFKSLYGLSEVLGVDMFMRHADPDKEQIKNEWTCNDVRVYRVNKVNGIRMAGYYSNDFYIDFDGTLLARLSHENANESVIDFSLAESGHLFRFGRELFTTYTLLLDIPESEKNYKTSDNTKELLFRLDLADYYGNGIEALANEYYDNKAALSQMGIIEPVIVSVAYDDIFGARRWVRMPFITSFVSWAMDQDPNLGMASIVGIAQQGDTMVFSGTLPDFASVSGVTIYYGADAPDTVGFGRAGLFIGGSLLYDATLESRREGRIAKIPTDDFAYSAFSIFNADEADAQVYTDNAMLRCTTNSNPLSYYRTYTAQGTTITDGNTHNLVGQFKNIDESETRGVSLLPRPSSTRYVFEMTTDAIDSAGTTNEIFARLNYVTTSGEERLGEAFSLMDAVRDFYGYWSGNTGDMGYLIGTAPGGKLIFTVDYPDVDHFNSIQLEFDSTGSDDWQINSISIYRVSSISQRYGKWLEVDKEIAGNKTDREFYRTYDTDRRVAHSEKKFLLTREAGLLITFDNSGGSSSTVTDINWNEIKESMTYNEARQDLGFTKERLTFLINVKVFSNSSASDTYGDCGSNNKFYFKLIFENGTSGFVQANQQLTADGFRAGQVETFSICVNRDYGEIRTVRVIPDDMIEEDKDIYDKLNIEYIEIIQQSTSGLSRAWRIDNIGWIGIDFKDQGEASSSRGQMPRTEGEISRNYLVSERGYTMNFLVALSTLDYETDVRYSGSLTATVYYRDLNGDLKDINVDLAQAMGDYAGKATTFNEMQGVDASLGGKMRRLIDTNYMLRPNSTDRFIISLTNVKTIVGMTLHATANVDTVWKINGIVIYNIIEDGPLLLNSNNEYQRDAIVDRLCASRSQLGYSIQTISNAQKNQPVAQDLSIPFEDNVISINSDSWQATVSRTSSEEEDTLNIFVFPGMHKGTQYYASDAIGFQASIKYQQRDSDKPYQLPINAFNVSTEKNMLYAYGIGTKGITLLSKLTLDSANIMYIDHAIIQHMRGDIVINSYYINFGGDDISNTLSGTPKSVTDTNTDKQIVSLQLSEDTAKTTLVKDNVDIEVVINYTNTNDIGDKRYSSSKISLTDLGMTEIDSGDVIHVEFNEPYVSEIKSVTLRGIGAFNATIKGVSIMTGNVAESGEFTPTAQYSISDTINIIRGEKIVDVTAEPVVPLNVELSVGSELVPGDEGVDSVGMEFTVTDFEENEEYIRIDDIRPYIVSGSLKPNDSVKLRMLLTDVTEIKTAKVTPITDSDSKEAAMHLIGASANWTVNTQEHSFRHVIDEIVTADKAYTVNFSSIVVNVSATILDAKDEPTTEFNTISGRIIPLELTLNPGYSVIFDASVAGSIEGFGYTVEVEACDGAENKSTMTEKDGKYIFKAEPVKDKDTAYDVKFISEENTSSVALIHVIVPAGDTTQEKKTEDTQTTETEKDTQTEAPDTEPAETA